MGSSTKIKLGFIGSYKCDIMLYLARTLLAAGKTAAIVDASSEHIWDYHVSKISNSTVVTQKGLDVFLSCDSQQNYEQMAYEEYDFILIDFGTNRSLAKYFKECSVHFIVLDMEKMNIIRLSSFLHVFFQFDSTEEDQQEKREFIRIYRDIIDSKINIPYINKIIGADDKINVALEYMMYLDGMDYKCRIENQYNDTIRFTKISKAFKHMLLEILDTFSNIEKKHLLKALKKAERGH
ncbi:MAG: hypothetical protein N2376_03210 [Clostridia bacterium]|nr:hypothetical protein [Clostridia bacterium]